MEPKVTYPSTRLHFKAIEIEPLADNEEFRVVTAIGIWQMSKADFYRVFPNVIASGSYSGSRGEYHYTKPPIKSDQFRIDTVLPEASRSVQSRPSLPQSPPPTKPPTGYEVELPTNVIALLDASVVGNVQIVKRMLEEGVSPNVEDETGEAPLTMAAYQGHLNIVAVLLEAGADHNAKDNDGKTAMDIAVSKGNVEMVRLLQRVASERISKPKRAVDIDNEPQLEALLKKLDNLVGLNLVKAHVRQKINLLRVQKMKEKEGLPISPQTLHMVFSGNPGTGKTTVARLIAEIYKCLGILSKGQLVEVNAKDLVGRHVGDTSANTTEAIENALGGVLFLDEAYALLTIPHYGQEAINTLLPALSNKSDEFMVIVAGYPELMKQFISSNPGLKRRFTEFIEFEDYLPEQLTEVFLRCAIESRITLAEGTIQKVTNVFEDLYRMRDAEFGNAGVATNLFAKAISNQSNRLAHLSSVTKESLATIRPEDIPNS